MRPVKDTMTLACVLNDTEKLAYGQSMSESLQSLQEAEARKKEFDSQIKADIEKYEARAHEIKAKLLSGKEFRPVECDIVYDWERKQRAWIRKDTGEVAHEDIIPEEMIQEELDLQEKKAQKEQAEAVEKHEKKSKK
jgi:hypothetical protein